MHYACPSFPPLQSRATINIYIAQTLASNNTDWRRRQETIQQIVAPNQNTVLNTFLPTGTKHTKVWPTLTMTQISLWDKSCIVNPFQDSEEVSSF